MKVSHDMDKVGGTSGHARIRLCGNHQTLDVSWLNSSLQDTLLPGKPWHKVKCLFAKYASINNDLNTCGCHLCNF